MKRLLREYRLVPVVLIAAGCLFALKALGLVSGGGYTLGERLARTETLVVTIPASPSIPLKSQTSTLDMAAAQPSGARQQSWMQEMFNYPDITGSVATPRPTSRAARADNGEPVIVTGSVDPAKPQAKDAPAKEGAAKEPAAKVEPPPTQPAAAAPAPVDASQRMSPAERAILERLHQRRQELDTRARELEIRETLIKAAEKKLEAKVAELKEAEARVTASLNKRDAAEAARFKSLVTMYETMKPKEAAKIFDRLDIKVLIDVSNQINPRRMSEILAQMTPEAAEKLTVELATQSNGGERAANPAELPKIGGRPNGT